jgi:hypothetical protein
MVQQRVKNVTLNCVLHEISGVTTQVVHRTCNISAAIQNFYLYLHLNLACFLQTLVNTTISLNSINYVINFYLNKYLELYSNQNQLKVHTFLFQSTLYFYHTII